MRVFVPDVLRRYTQDEAFVEAVGDSLADVLDDLDRQYPGIRFRMIDEQDHVRRHIILAVDGERTECLQQDVRGVAELVIMQALSGG